MEWPSGDEPVVDPVLDPAGEVAALLTAAAGEHELAGRNRLARAHLRRARTLSGPDAA